MKRISAVICELNPLHEGHRFVFNRAKVDSDVLIAVMSGNFVQRGETAVYDKYNRAEAALKAGANIVFELPFPFSSSSAEFFAHSGVAIAEGVGADRLFFGSECGDIYALKKAAAVLSSEEYREGMKVGRSAAIRGELLKKLCPELPKSLLESPNDILGAEYCRRASIETVPVKRITAESASSIRERSLNSVNTDMLSPKKLRELEFLFFRTIREGRADLCENGGGVFERLWKSAFAACDADAWELSARTKQYTNARLRRAALFALCSVKSSDIEKPAMYTRLLGADEKGRDHLSSIRKNCEFHIITNPSDKKKLNADALKQYEIAEFADSIYALCQGFGDAQLFARKKPIMI